MRRVLVTFVLLAACAAPASAAAVLRGSVLGNGAARVTSPSLSFEGTVGQAIVGVSTGPARVVYHGFWVAGGARVAGVDDDPDAPAVPHALRFGAPSPNPSRAAVRFGVSLPKDAKVTLEILDLQGRRIASVAPGSLAAGEHQLFWNGRDDSGARASAGVFFARLHVDDRTVGTRRIVLTR